MGQITIILSTQLDTYVGAFLHDYHQAPSVGDKIWIHKGLRDGFRNAKLPLRLEVISREWIDADTLKCELHYNKLDLEIAKAAGCRKLY